MFSFLFFVCAFSFHPPTVGADDAAGTRSAVDWCPRDVSANSSGLPTATNRTSVQFVPGSFFDEGGDDDWAAEGEFPVILTQFWHWTFMNGMARMFTSVRFSPLGRDVAVIAFSLVLLFYRYGPFELQGPLGTILAFGVWATKPDRSTEGRKRSRRIHGLYGALILSAWKTPEKFTGVLISVMFYRTSYYRTS